MKNRQPLTQRDLTIIGLLSEAPKISPAKMSEKTGIPLVTIYRRLSLLRSRGVITRDGIVNHAVDTNQHLLFLQTPQAQTSDLTGIINEVVKRYSTLRILRINSVMGSFGYPNPSGRPGLRDGDHVVIVLSHGPNEIFLFINALKSKEQVTDVRSVSLFAPGKILE